MGLFSRKPTESTPQARAEARRNVRGSGREARPPLDPAETQKRQARRRLIGAAALVLGVIVFLPMVFDPGPKPLADDIVVQIPGKDTPFNPAGAGKAPAVPETSPQGVTPDAPVAPAAPPMASAPDNSPPAKANPEKSAAEKSAAEKVTPAKADADKTAPPKAAPPAADAARALALLEAKGETKPSASGDNNFSVQIGAYASAESVRDLRAKLTKAGLKSYTEVVTMRQGERTRVRIGPFATREDAERARERLKKHLSLDGSIVTS